MPLLSSHDSNEYAKLLLIGDPGTAKTGGLVSLVEADYQLRIEDWDNGLDALKKQIEHRCPDKINNVEYVTLRDVRKATADGPAVINPTAFIRGIKLLDRWRYTDSQGFETDLGVPAGWGPNVILVLDSLTFMSDAAFDWREPLTPRGAGGKYDVRAVYKDAQDAIENVLALLTSEGFKTNVIVTAHVRYLDAEDGTRKGYPTSVGAKLSTVIGRYFNSIALCQTKLGGRRTIQTVSTAEIDLKNPDPFRMAKELPIETGLATFFNTLLKKEAPVKETPKSEPSVKSNRLIRRI